MLKRVTYTIFLFLFSTVFGSYVYGQSRVVKGSVKNYETQKTLPGVNVVVKGTTTGVSTDSAGHYRLKIPSGQDTLVFSYIGYKKKEIAIKNQRILNVYLKPTSISGKQMVVVGYGEEEKRSLTSAISSLPVKKLTQTPTANISNALAGRIPGLLAVQSSGEPGNDASRIWIRGFGTLNGKSQQPLILVDGVERSYRETFDNIDPHAIESISILKDASATAIYGVRGANGVILVKTRQGHVGSTDINVSLQTGVQTPTRLPDYLGSYDALTLYREGLQNDGLPYSNYTDKKLQKYKISNHNDEHPAWKYLYPNVNWEDELLRQYAPESRANLNVSGGTESAQYFVSASYYRQSGIYKQFQNFDNYDVQAKDNKYNFRANTHIQLAKDLKLNLNVSGIFKRRNYPTNGSSRLFSRIKATPAWWYPKMNPDSTISALQNKDENPYSLLTQHGYTRYFETNSRATGGFKLNMPWLTKGFSLRTKFTFTSLAYRNIFRTTAPNQFRYSASNDNIKDLSQGTYTKLYNGSNTLDYGVGTNQRRRTRIDLFFNYNRDFGPNSVSGLIHAQRRTYVADAGGGDIIGGLPHNIQGIVGRLRYGFKDKYFAKFTFGYNGSENFEKGKRYGFFPSYSVGWIASDEPFIQKMLPFLNYLKFRASAGSAGNDQAGRFIYQSTWTQGAAGYTFGKNHDGNGYGGASLSQIGNPDVTWERSHQYNIGLNFRALNNALTFDGDLFYEHRTNILTAPGTIPGIIGVPVLPQINAGVVNNRGVDFDLQYTKVFNEQQLRAKITYTFARNKIISQDAPPYKGKKYQSPEGRRVGEQQGLIALGLFKNEAEIKNSPRQAFGPVQPGDIKYLDRNGDGIINDQDNGYLGDISDPETQFGLNLQYNYKSWDMSILFQGSLGGNTYYTGTSVYPFARYANVLADVKNNHWTTDNRDPHAKYPRMTSNANRNNYQNSTYWLRSSDYMRLKNAEIGYSFPKNWLTRFNFKSARIYLNGVNLLTFAKNDLFDPEAPNGTGGYPQQKVFNVGLDFSF